MTRYIALLRGINVGGHQLPMARLRQLMSDAGAVDVETYIQSGNIVFTHPTRSEPKLCAHLAEVIGAGAGFGVPVMLRTAPQLREVVDANPYPADDPTKLHVAFFPHPPPAGAFDHVDPVSVLPEEMTLVGRDLYLHLPNGMGRAKLPLALGKAMAPATARNWRTVTKLLELLSR